MCSLSAFCGPLSWTALALAYRFLTLYKAAQRSPSPAFPCYAIRTSHAYAQTETSAFPDRVTHSPFCNQQLPSPSLTPTPPLILHLSFPPCLICMCIYSLATLIVVLCCPQSVLPHLRPTFFRVFSPRFS